MNVLKQTKAIREAMIKNIEKINQWLTTTRSEVKESGLSKESKGKWLDTMDKTSEKLRKLEAKVSQKDPNSYRDYLNARKYAKEYVSLHRDVSSIQINLRKEKSAPNQTAPQTSFNYNLPDVPTGPIIRKAPSASASTVPDSILKKVVAINDQLSQAKSEIHQLFGLLHKNTTEEKVHRVGKYNSLVTTQRALQVEVDGIIKSFLYRSKPLTQQESGRINQKLDQLAKKIEGFNNRISADVLANAPKAPTSPVKMTHDDDDQPRNSGPRR